MSSGPFGPDGEEPADEESSSAADNVGSLSGGSVRPSAAERTWIHPAELPSTRVIAHPSPSAGTPRWIQVTLGVAATMLLLVGISFLSRSLPSSDSKITVLSASRLSQAPDSVAQTARAMTVLTVTSHTGAVRAPGIALVSRKIITTTTAIPTDALVYADDLQGHRVAAMNLHTDRTVGLTVLVFAVPVVRAVADVAAEPSQGGSTAVSLATGGATQPVRWSSAQISSIDALLNSKGHSIGSITGTSPLSDEADTVLTSNSGRVEAISSPSLATDAFLPASFASALSTQLIVAPTGTHGRLGIAGSTAREGGAKVVEVASDGPAAGILAPGDVILGVDGHTVASAAEMVDAVYLEPAGSVLNLTVQRGHTISNRAVTLTPSP